MLTHTSTNITSVKGLPFYVHFQYAQLWKMEINMNTTQIVSVWEFFGIEWFHYLFLVG